MKKCICIHTPKNTNFIINEEYFYDYIMDGVKIYIENSFLNVDEITFYLHFKKI